MNTREQLDRIDEALRQGHQERTRDHRAAVGTHRVGTHQLQCADMALLALMGACAFVWALGGVTLVLRLAGYS